MSLYSLLVVVHVVAAVLGGGLVLALAIVAHGAAPAAAVSALGARLERLLRASAATMGVLLLSGVAVTYVAGGTLNQALWLRASALLLVAIGILGAITRRRLVRALSAVPAPAAALRSVEKASLAMCAAVATIAFLMSAKPF